MANKEDIKTALKEMFASGEIEISIETDNSGNYFLAVKIDESCVCKSYIS